MVDLAKPGSDWKCAEGPEGAAEGHWAMHFERWGEVVDPDCGIMLAEVAEGVAAPEGHLAMHFGVT